MAGQKGLTYIEIVVTLAILSTLSAVGYPPLQSWCHRAGFQSEVFSLLGSLRMAKMEAVKTGSYVVVAVNSNGYSAFVDDNKDWMRQDGEREIVNCRLRNGLTLATNFHLPADKTRFGSQPNVRAGRFILTDINNKRMDVIVDIVGRIRAE